MISAAGIYLNYKKIDKKLEKRKCLPYNRMRKADDPLTMARRKKNGGKFPCAY